MEMLIEKAPYIASILLVVVIFVRAWANHQTFLQQEAQRRDKFELERLKELERIGTTCHAHTKELNERTCKAIDHNTSMMEKNIKIIGAIERRMNGGAR